MKKEKRPPPTKKFPEHFCPGLAGSVRTALTFLRRGKVTHFS